MKDDQADLDVQMLSTNRATRRDFLKTAGSLYLMGLAHPLLTSCGSGQRTPDYSRTIAEMTTYINEQMTAQKVNGLAIALVDDQRTVWARGFGKADVANDIPATADTHFEIGSNSKTFAGVMIAQLVERGLLSIDDPLAKYLPDFRIGAPLGFPGGGPVTIGSMLTHHSGIPGDVMNGGFTFGASRPDLNQWLLDYLANDLLRGNAFPSPRHGSHLLRQHQPQSHKRRFKRVQERSRGGPVHLQPGYGRLYHLDGQRYGEVPEDDHGRRDG
jgi:CubicO group peptidase (beta-lactamase class C family)